MHRLLRRARDTLTHYLLQPSYQLPPSLGALTEEGQLKSVHIHPRAFLSYSRTGWIAQMSSESWRSAPEGSENLDVALTERATGL